MGIALYNKLPQNLKKLDMKHTFKNKKKFLLQNVYYSVDEYLLVKTLSCFHIIVNF